MEIYGVIVIVFPVSGLAERARFALIFFINQCAENVPALYGKYADA
jgi:hypothetical protein